jgi:hypothetical protein
LGHTIGDVAAQMKIDITTAQARMPTVARGTDITKLERAIVATDR